MLRSIMPLQAIARLILLRVKVERAKKHLIDLEGEIAAHRGKYLSVVIGPGSKGFAQMSENPVALPVLPWSAVASAGDVVHNLRSALDHLAHQLVLVGTPGKEQTRRIEFPSARDLATYENTKGAKVVGMRQEAIEAIDALQPYKGGNDGLWRIHELDNIDKHRGLFTVERDCIFTAEWMPDD